MADMSTVGLPCLFSVGIHEKGSWAGWEKPCGDKTGTVKDPRQERYDIGLCPRHLRTVLDEEESNAAL